ncbi:Hypothetical protein A7982_06015 [Minicystis rosea]|nr:Hypothetical protein A7982_06015 [Minicystis rosea]
MARVDLFIPAAELDLECHDLTGHEALGEAATFEITAFSQTPIDPDAVIGRPCAIRLSGEHDQRLVGGVVTRISTGAVSRDATARRHVISVRSSFAALELRRQTKVFQHMTVPDIVKAVLERGAYGADAIELNASGSHEARDYVVQYAETDAAFVRRLCEDDGLYFRFETTDEGERFLLEDQSSNAPEASASLTIVDDAMDAAGPAAFHCHVTRRRRPGKVTLRDYFAEKPRVALEGVATAGVDAEQGLEVYEAPGGFRAGDAGRARAQLRLESLRADALSVTFQTNALGLAPGVRVALELGPDYTGAARPEGKHFIVGLTHQFSHGGRYQLMARAIPESVPYRLPKITPRPVMHGVHPAKVTGPSGQEIHADSLGRVRVRFPWDREGPQDDKSSLPVRTMQMHMPGSMAIPRVGWEVLVAFEDGDPDRPIVLGRTYNGKQPPPEALPANKTVTRVGTFSSPGGGALNGIQYDDAAGRQHMVIQAAFAKSTKVANNMVTQTVKNESLLLKGSQTRTVGSNEDVSVTQAHIVGVGSQSATVGAMQKIYVKGNMGISVGSESVLVGGALLEKVGNPVTGAKGLLEQAALAGAGALGTWGQVAAGIYQVGKGAVEGGWSGALTAAAGVAGGLVPGGDAVVSSITGAPPPAPWNEQPQGGGPQAGGGGSAGATDSSAAQGPGPGHRGTWVEGAMMEMIGAAHTVITPGSIGWTTTGASALVVGGSHTTKTMSADLKVLGAHAEQVGSLKIKTKSGTARKIKGALTTQIGGGLKSESGGAYGIKSRASMSIRIGGSLKVDGSSIVFSCGDSTKVAVSSGGVEIVASDITITGKSKQGGKSTHQ